jgi:hopene-associated glycosyltransferase HpnB
MSAIVLACAALAVWVYLMAARGGFWRCAERDEEGASVALWPSVVAVIPARDEADGVAQTIGSLLKQDYPGAFAVVLVDDGSTDATVEVARRAAATTGEGERLRVLAGSPLPAGWTGKLWAMKQGVESASRSDASFVLFADADIVFASGALRRLVSIAKRDDLALVSLMAKLRCESFIERALIPAFIFFFQMLYPFSWVNDPSRGTAAAAGGCMLVRRDVLEAIGGLEAIRGALIDDCALAGEIKRRAPIRLALTEQVTSTRSYSTLWEARSMIVRSAYAQLRYSRLLLAGTVAAMTLTYLAPPLLALFGQGFAQYCGLATWAIMAIALQPTLSFYRLSPLWGIFLPAVATVYLAFTVDSAYQHARGRSGFWKGRAQGHAARAQ